MNAFTQLKKRTQISKFSAIDTEDLEIVNDPVMSRSMPKGKYEEQFSKLKPGQAIKCKTEHTARVSHAMRVWMKRRNIKNLRVSSVTDYGDGMGRVWMLKTESQ